MSNISTIVIKPCQEFVQHTVEVQPENNGQLLNVHVCLQQVIPCKHVVVGVIIYRNNQPYALKTKEIYSGDIEHYCYACHRPYPVDVSAGLFEFLFDSFCIQECICIKVVAHYMS